MNIQDTKNVIKTLIKEKTPVTPMLWAQHGMGKSSVIHQLGAELGYSVFTIILSQKEAVDIAGVLYTFENKELGMSVTSSHPPDWFATALSKGKAILFLDEFNMARKEVLNAAFELVLDRRLNNLKLPEDVFIVCAGNPDDERYDVTPLSESLRDRLMHLKVTPDVDTWLRWAKSPSSGIHPDVIKFVEMNPKSAFALDNRDEAFPVEIKHSFRSWERVGLIHKLTLPLHLKAECIRGIVGVELAAAFIATFGTKDTPLDAIEILGMSTDTVKRIQEYCSPKKMRIDLLTQSIDNLVDFCVKNTDTAGKKLNNVKRFIKMLPDDVAQSAISQLFELSDWSDSFLSDNELRSKIETISEATALAKAK